MSILLNRMSGPQNYSHRKSTFIMLTLHLWQITVKFYIAPLTVIKLLLSSTLNLWQSLPSGFHIKTETSDAKFNNTPLPFGSLLSLTLYLWQWLSLKLLYRSRYDQCKVQNYPSSITSTVKFNTTHMTVVSSVFPNKIEIPMELS